MAASPGSRMAAWFPHSGLAWFPYSGLTSPGSRIAATGSHMAAVESMCLHIYLRTWFPYSGPGSRMAAWFPHSGLTWFPHISILGPGSRMAANWFPIIDQLVPAGKPANPYSLVRFSGLN